MDAVNLSFSDGRDGLPLVQGEDEGRSDILTPSSIGGIPDRQDQSCSVQYGSYASAGCLAVKG